MRAKRSRQWRTCSKSASARSNRLPPILQMEWRVFVALGVVVIGGALGALAQSKRGKTVGFLIEMLGFLAAVLVLAHDFALTK